MFNLSPKIQSVPKCLNQVLRMHLSVNFNFELGANGKMVAGAPKENNKSNKI